MKQKRFKKLLMARGFTREAADLMVEVVKWNSIYIQKAGVKELKNVEISYYDTYYNAEFRGIGKPCNVNGKVAVIRGKRVIELQEKRDGQ